jgi:serine/threonine protein kinase
MADSLAFTGRTIDIPRPDGSFARYLLGAVLPEVSGCGWIFHAECEGIAREFACKIQKPQGKSYAWDPQSAELKAFAALEGCPSLLLGFDPFETDEGYVGFFMEFCTGHDLLTLLEDLGIANPMPIEDARVCCRMILTAISEVHSRDWVHRDVKPENFMIQVWSENNEPFRRLLLGDFGTATEDSGCLTGRFGTHGYLAPEMMNGFPYSKAADMWSVGCCLYWIVTGWHPFDELLGDEPGLTQAVTEGEFDMKRLVKATGECPEVVPLIQGLLCPNPQQRLTAAKALESPFFGLPDPDRIRELLEEAERAAAEHMRECQPGI